MYVIKKTKTKRNQGLLCIALKPVKIQSEFDLCQVNISFSCLSSWVTNSFYIQWWHLHLWAVHRLYSGMGILRLSSDLRLFGCPNLCYILFIFSPFWGIFAHFRLIPENAFSNLYIVGLLIILSWCIVGLKRNRLLQQSAPFQSHKCIRMG